MATQEHAWLQDSLICAVGAAKMAFLESLFISRRMERAEELKLLPGDPEFFTQEEIEWWDHHARQTLWRQRNNALHLHDPEHNVLGSRAPLGSSQAPPKKKEDKEEKHRARRKATRLQYTHKWSHPRWFKKSSSSEEEGSSTESDEPK